MLKRLISKIWNQWARVEYKNVGLTINMSKLEFMKKPRKARVRKKKQFHGKMTVFNNIWQAYLTLQVSLILPLILIIAANVAVVASTMIEKKCQNIWDNNMAVRLGKYSGSLGVCAQKYVLCPKTFLMCAEKNISRNIYITSAQIQLYECENIYFTAQKLLGSRRNS